MPVKVKCTGCQAALNIPDRARGKTVKCPKCGTALRIPAAAPAKRKPASVASGDSSEFFADLDLDRLEDRSTRVCPKCGSMVGQEDVDCPVCGADVQTGGLGTAQRARRGRKGAAPSEYYSKAIKDAARYTGKKQSLAWKSVGIFAGFGVLALLCWMMVIWTHNLPPTVFWVFVASVLTLLLPGWIWLVQNELVKRTLDPKQEKYPVRMEPFIAVSLGIKSISWSLIFGLPVWLVLGLPGLILTNMESGSGPVLIIIACSLFAILALVSWPIAQAHFAMPVTGPGWLVHKVLSDVGRNIGPCLHWATFAVLTAIPVAGIAAGAWLLTPAVDDLTALVETLEYNSQLGAAKQAVEDAQERREQPTEEMTRAAQGEFRDIDWMLLLWPAVAIVVTALPLGFWTVYNARSAALLVKLFRPNMLELVGHEKEYVYVVKSREEREKQAEESQTWTTVFASVGVTAALGLAGGVIYATFADGVGYLEGIATGLMLFAGLMSLGSIITICRIAWDDSPLVAIASFFIGIVLIIYCLTHWEKTKYPFVTLLLLTLVSFIGVGLQIFAAASQVAAEAAAAAAAAG
jgi:multisubunit Na+/H+ antiporter MnhF subunit/ssDNA-binding Zn-finger/Zn-ribbon topoisomerase 1